MKIIPLINEITHIFKNIENSFSKSIPTFYRYIHNNHFPSLNDEMLAGAYNYKPRKRTGEENKIRIDNSIRKGRTLDNMREYLNVHQNANIVEMDTVIGKQEDKKYILTLLNNKLMLMFEIVLTDNGWEFLKPNDIEFDYNTGEKLINIFYCNPYSSWEKGGIERNHEFIRYIIPKGISFDQLTNKNLTDMMNNINNVKRRSMEYKTPYETFNSIYGEKITKNFILNISPKMKLI